MSLKNLLIGDRVRLTSFRDEDMEVLETWYNDVSFLRVYDVISAFPKSYEQVKEMISQVRKSDNSYIFAIRDVKTDKIIGVSGFENILWNNGVSVIYIGIGNEKFRGGGYGREALSLALEFGFQELNLHRIQLNVLSYNEPAIKLYEKLGFKREGVYREFIHRDGKRYDMYLYGLLRDEWGKLKEI